VRLRIRHWCNCLSAGLVDDKDEVRKDKKVRSAESKILEMLYKMDAKLLSRTSFGLYLGEILQRGTWYCRSRES
jgi:hypothetical protein